MTIRTLTALFDSPADAERAQQRLTEIGIPPDAIHLIDQKSGPVAAAPAEPMGFWAKLKHIFLPEEDRYIYEEGVRRGGVLLTAPVDEMQADGAITVLDECNAIDLERRQEEWRQAGWAGFQAAPVAGSTTAQGSGAQAAGIQEEVIPVAEERLRVGKREVTRGSMRVRSYIVEEPVQEEVRLRDEHVEVERRAIDQPAAPGSEDALMKERMVEMTETAEEPVVQKDTQVKEEVVVRKRADERVEQVKDTVRHTEVDVEKEGSDQVPPRGPTGRPEERQRPRH
jgi:uncharacterized protein (TIGR02271 family)